MTETAPGPSTGSDDPNLTMGIDPYERNWMRLSIALLVAFAATITVAGFSMGFAVPGADGEVDPRTVLETEPWSSPGLREISPGVYEAYVVAQTWSFNPRELEVPVGSELTIYVTSPDVQHGFSVRDTNVNMQVVPGQVSKLSYTFDEVGEFPYICNEYCGQGHAAMYGVVNVVPASAVSAGNDNDNASDSAEAQGDADGQVD